MGARARVGGVSVRFVQCVEISCKRIRVLRFNVSFVEDLGGLLRWSEIGLTIVVKGMILSFRSVHNFI